MLCYKTISLIQLEEGIAKKIQPVSLAPPKYWTGKYWSWGIFIPALASTTQPSSQHPMQEQWQLRGDCLHDLPRTRAGQGTSKHVFVF